MSERIIPLSAVSSLPGHSSPAVTMKYYNDKAQMSGSIAGSLNLTSRLKRISTTLGAEAGGKNQPSTNFHSSSDQEKTPSFDEVSDDKVRVAEDGIEPPTQGFSVLCSTD